MAQTPLAERMRPVTLDQLAGQEHLTGSGSILRTAIEQGKIPSMILWGPPGVGKTTIVTRPEKSCLVTNNNPAIGLLR